MAEQSTVVRVRAEVQNLEGLNRLRTAVRGVASEAKAGSNDFNRLLDSIRSLDAAAVRSISGLQRQRDAFDAIRRSANLGSDAFKQATAEIARLDKQLQQVEGRGTGVGGRAGRIAQTAGAIASGGVFGGPEGLIGGAIGGIAGGPTGALAGAAIGAQIGQLRQLAGSTADYAASINKQRIALQLVTKNSGEYQRALQFIDRTSRQLAIPQEVITEQFTKLTASVKGAGGNVRDAERAFLGIAAGIRGTGGNLEQLNSALTATSQVFSKGKVSAEELRQQIGERLPGAFSLFAKSIGLTPQELDKALEKGQVSLLDFQKFTEQLFLQYGENARIIADGPDAAGDRLRTSLSRLQESVGSLLKPIGAAFQSTFARIVAAIDAAVRKLNTFFGLGKGRQGEINQLQAQLNATDKALRTARDAQRQPAVLGLEFLKGDFGVRIQQLEQRRTQQFTRLQALLAAETTAAKQQGETESRLPGITPQASGESPKTKQAKKIVDLTKEELALLKEIKRLEDAGLDIQAVAQRFRLEELQVSLQLERNNIGNNQAIAESLKNQRTLARAVEAAFQGYGNELIKGLETQKEINKVLQDAEIKSGKITEEEAKRLLITRQIEEFIARFPLATEQQIARLRAALEQTKKAQSFAEDFKTSFKSVSDAALDLGNSLGSTIGNAFAGLGDQLAEFVTTGKASFADFTRSVLADLAKIFARAAIFAGLKAIFQGSGIGNFLGFAMGGVMTENGPMPLKRYASGGIANSPQIAMFGEGSRPEAYVPLPDGRSIPVTMSGQGGGVNVVVNVDAKGSEVQGNGSQANALGVALSSAVKAEIIRQQRPGGLLAGTR